MGEEARKKSQKVRGEKKDAKIAYMREALTRGDSKDSIKEFLNISKKTYYRYLEIINKKTYIFSPNRTK
jgi:hypothetical protein